MQTKRISSSEFKDRSERIAKRISVGLIVTMCLVVFLFGITNLPSNAIYAGFLGSVLAHGFLGPPLMLALTWYCFVSEEKRIPIVGLAVLAFPVAWSIYALSGRVLLVP